MSYAYPYQIQDTYGAFGYQAFSEYPECSVWPNPNRSSVDNVQLQAALDRLESLGGGLCKVYGTLTMGAQLGLPTNVIIQGIRNTSTIRGNGNVNSPLIVPKNPGSTSQTVIRDLKILESSGGFVGTGVDLSDASNMMMERVRIEGFNVGLLIDDNTNTTFYDNFVGLIFFDNIIGIDIGPLGTLANQHTFTGTRIRPRAGNAASRGVRITSARGITFVGLNCESAGTAANNGRGVELTSRDATNCAREVEFVNAWIENNNVGVSADANVKRVGFDGSTITGNTTDISDSSVGGLYWRNCNRNGAIQSDVIKGNGTPEGTVTANVGTIYQRLDGGALTSMYVKESGTGNTGWVAK